MIKNLVPISYSEISAKAEVPTKDRELLTVQRSSGIFEKVAIRKHHLTTDELNALKLKANGKHINPYVRKGCYRATIEALMDLGVDQWHSFISFREKFKEVMNLYSVGLKKNLWTEYANKMPRNNKTGKDLTGRILQNMTILQRVSGLHPYGLKVAACGLKIEIKKENGVYYFILKTNFDNPHRVI